MIRTLADGKESLVLRGEGHAIGGLELVAGRQVDRVQRQRRTIRHEQTPAYSGSKIIYTISENVPGETDVVNARRHRHEDARLGRRLRRTPVARRGATSWSIARRPTSRSARRRWSRIAGGEPKVLHEEVADKFWSITGDAGAQPSPDGKWIAFLSDRDGWDHRLRHAEREPSGERTEPMQITKGKFEVRAPQWSPDSTRIAFDANEPDHYGDRHLYVATIGSDPAHATIAAVTSGRGTDIGPQWSPDGTRLVYQHTDPHNSADLWVAASRKPSRRQSGAPVRLDAGGDGSIARSSSRSR